jgi:hypothetical protein
LADKHGEEDLEELFYQLISVSERQHESAQDYANSQT